MSGNIVRDDPTNNVPDSIFSKLGLQLHRRHQHPIGILKNAIYEYFDNTHAKMFVKFDDLCPIVSVKQVLLNRLCEAANPVVPGSTDNFDDVLVPVDHVSRSYNDTYYVDANTVLRCHTSAHQAELLRNGHTHFLVTGDVYRRDSIDSTHYPVFHQMEGVRVFTPDEWAASGMEATSYAAMDLKKTLEGLAQHLFGPVEMRWVDTLIDNKNTAENPASARKMLEEERPAAGTAAGGAMVAGREHWDDACPAMGPTTHRRSNPPIQIPTENSAAPPL
ncbi:hypothetical protein ACLOJK_024144 [Asimina triloba]